MPSLSVHGVLFDLDGVLVDSTPAVERHWRSFANRNNLDAELILNCAHGRRSREVIGDFVPASLVTSELAWFEKLEIRDVEGVEALPGAESLTALLPLGSWAIVTSCGKALAHVRLTAAGLSEPEWMITADDVERGKPDPEGYLKGLECLELGSEAAVVFEDAPSGVRAARAAGIRTVGVESTFSAGELASDFVVANLASIEVDSSRSPNLMFGWI
ncbi:MAG: HAD-IA family hydrolase [Acidimicrobiales bacterium]